MLKPFTTGQVAQICQVAPSTVSKWFDSGRLQGFRIPGSLDRRYPRERVIKFLKDYGMPLGELKYEGVLTVLVVSATGELSDQLKRRLPEAVIFTAGGSFGAGCVLREHVPAAGVVDMNIGSLRAASLCGRLKGYSLPIILVVKDKLGNNPPPVTDVFVSPFDAALLATRLRTLAMIATP